ncbi:hypothetical protein [Arenimonas sp.]|uniref:hypothetical protein n=1 Tax=Arenimonas sp. TaxID=1872635 RepID=UPI0039E41D6F
MGTLQVMMANGSGGGSGGAAITDQYVQQTGSLGLQTAGYRINTSGDVESLKKTTYAVLETWLLSGSASDYDVRFTHIDGPVPDGDFSGWLNLAGSAEISITSVAVGEVKICRAFVELALAGSGIPFASATITLESERL